MLRVLQGFLAVVLLLEAATAIARPTAADIKHALSNIDSITLVALEPVPHPSIKPRPHCENSPCVRDWLELGRVEITKEARVVADELEAWVHAPTPEGYTYCFFPHHAVLLRSGDFEFEFLICYSCSKTLVYAKGFEYHIAEFNHQSSPAPFNQLLRIHSVPISYTYGDPENES